jgi:hypothetical protein
MQKMMPLLFCLLISFWSYGQNISPEVISSSGGREVGTNMVIDWVLGEVATTTITGSNNTITQGFHQPYYIITRIEKVASIELDVNVFPNPTTKFITVATSLPANTDAELLLLNMEGKELKRIQLRSENENILLDLSNYPAGNYFLNIISPSNKTQQTYKIQKIR